jgi:glycosyltransferase involved in cell wall biosynthesis
MCSKTPLVSVIVPTFNRAHLIGETLLSVINQTYSHFEILVVDDGSTDDTEKLVRGFQDTRILYLKQPNSGLPASPRNLGIQHAKGKYLAFLDSDDLWLPEKLAFQVDYLEKHPNVGLLYTQCIGFIDKDQDIGQPFPEIGIAKSGWIYNDLILSDNYIPCLTVMIRGDILNQTGNFNESTRLRAVEDFDLWLRISRLTQAGYIPTALAKYRMHTQGISRVEATLLENRLYLLNYHEMSGYIDRKRLKRIRFQIYLRLLLTRKHTSSSGRMLICYLGSALVNCPSMPVLFKIFVPILARRLRNFQAVQK